MRGIWPQAMGRKAPRVRNCGIIWDRTIYSEPERMLEINFIFCSVSNLKAETECKVCKKFINLLEQLP